MMSMLMVLGSKDNCDGMIKVIYKLEQDKSNNSYGDGDNDGT